LWRRSGPGSPEQVVSWRVAQKYFFDPTLGGAILAGRRNVFRTLTSLTAFAFADTARRFSPLVSDIRFSLGSRLDAQFRADFDPTRRRITGHELLVNMRPYGLLEATIAHFAVNATPVLQPRSDQIRAVIGYGDLSRQGLNGAFGFSYDLRQKFLQNQIAQVSFNGSCCGIALEYRRLGLGQVRRGNEFRAALIIANLGMFGNLRRREVIF
jgi:LPS-assembly protein